MRFAVCTAAPKTSRVSCTTRPEVAADADRDVLALDLQVRVAGDGRLHLDGGVHGRIAVAEGRHDLVAHGLDDRTAVLLRSAAHDLDAGLHLVTRRDVAQHLEQPGTADHVGKKDCELLLSSHTAGARCGMT